MSHKFILSAILAFLVAFASPAFSQSDVEAVDREAVAAKISEQASSFLSTIENLTGVLGKLPRDMEGATALADEMLASVDKIIEQVSSGEIENDINAMREYAVGRRTFWEERCNTNHKEKDCGYVELWNEQVTKALKNQKAFEDTIRDMKQSRDGIGERRIYLVEDIRLKRFNDVTESLNAAIDEMKKLAGSMSVLAGDLGAPGPDDATTTD